MFAEEEWNDDPDAKALTRAVVCGTERSDNTDVTPKGVGKKKSLLRTLQTLSSVPNWTNGSLQEASDSESEEVPSTTKRRKKKRSKKRKRARAAGGEGEEMGQQKGEKEDPGAVMAKKKRPKQAKSTNTGKPELVRESKDSHPEKKDEDGSALSRQKWRNKMKMKKKSKNKFRPHDETTTNTTKAVSSVVNNEKKTVQAQTLKGEKAQKQDESKARKRKKPEKGKEENCVSLANKKKRENKKAKLRDESEGTAEGTEPEESKPQTETEVKGPELGVQRKPQQSKEKRMLAEKMRRLLHSDGSSRRLERSTEEEEEEKERGEEGGESKALAEESVPDRSAALRSKMVQRLESARFRYINEQLYTSSSGEARRIFQQDPQASGIYHRGYTAQVQRWPVNPVDAIISFIKHKPVSLVVADFGCGDCKIARSVKNKVHSFDLAPVCNLVTVCDMTHVPLRGATVDIAVFCLSLMGTNLGDFLIEANRVLVMGGVLKIAEVASRFENVRSFIGALCSLGFKQVTKDTENSHFYSFEFVKTGEASESFRKVGLQLRPCVYKKR